MFQLANNVDYSRVEIVNLYKYPIHLRPGKKDALVCGWGAVKNDDESIEDSIGCDKYSGDLHCMCLNLHSEKTCNRAILPGDYKRKLVCGKEINSTQMITSVTIL